MNNNLEYLLVMFDELNFVPIFCSIIYSVLFGLIFHLYITTKLNLNDSVTFGLSAIFLMLYVLLNTLSTETPSFLVCLLVSSSSNVVPDSHSFTENITFALRVKL